MNLKTILAILLIALGVVAFAYQGITYSTRSEGVDMGPIHMSTERTHRIPLPPIVGGIALVGGIVLLIADRKRFVGPATSLGAAFLVAALGGCVQQPAPSPGAAPQQSSNGASGFRAPESRTHYVTVPQGTEVHMTLASSIGSATSSVGDAVTGTTTTAIVIGDQVAIPVGSTIHGRVTGVDPATKGLDVSEKGGALALSFTKLTTPAGDSSAMSGSLTSIAKSGGKTGGIIGGSAAGGALLGKILGGSTKDAAIGAVIGTGIGTGIAAGTKGKEVVIPAGTDLALTLDQPLTLARR